MLLGLLGPRTGAKMETLRLFVADDHDLVRRGLRSLLEEQPGWEVVAEASDGKKAVAKILETNPDVAILDIRMPVLDGLEVARRIRTSGSKTRILILTMHESDTLIREMLDAGVRGYLLKNDAGRELVAAVEAVRYNKTYFTSKVSQMILDGYLRKVRDADGTEPVTRLTPRQQEILKLLAKGKNSKEAAEALGLSLKTVETHRADMMRRLNCHSLSELVRYALRNEVIDP
jgi:DNA-binding NarL/FixJ family response regulator